MAVLDREKINIIILMASQTLFGVAAVTMMVLGGIVGQRLASDPQMATLPIAMMMIGSVLSTLPASLFMKRVGRRIGFITGTVLGASGGLVCYVGIANQSFLVFCLGSLLLGFYQGFATYYRFAAADVASPAFRSRAISYVLAGGIIAAFLGPWNANVASSLIADVPNGAPYLIIALLALIAASLLSQLKVPPSGEAQAADSCRPLMEIAKQPAFIVAVLVAALGYSIMILVMTATPLAMKSMSYELPDIASVMRWHVLGMFVPSLFTGNLIAKVGVSKILFSGAFICTLAVSIAVSGSSLNHFLAALVLLGLSWNFLFVGGSTLLSTIHSESERGKVQGINDLIVFVLVALGSLLSGALFHHLGWVTLNLMMLLLIAMIVVAVICLSIYARDSVNAGKANV